MITCPNCGAQNADDAIHCGQCGHKIAEEGGRKTMFGMAALNVGDIQKAAEQAQQARQAAEGAAAEEVELAKTEVMQSVTDADLGPMPGPSAAAPAEPAPDPFADDFAQLEAQYGNENFTRSEAPTAENPSLASQMNQGGAPADQGFGGAGMQGGAQGPQGGLQPNQGFGNSVGPSPNGFGSSSSSPQGFGKPTNSDLMISPAKNDLEKKSNNNTLIIVGAILLIGLFMLLTIVGALVIFVF